LKGCLDSHSRRIERALARWNQQPAFSLAKGLGITGVAARSEQVLARRQAERDTLRPRQILSGQLCREHPRTKLRSVAAWLKKDLENAHRVGSARRRIHLDRDADHPHRLQCNIERLARAGQVDLRERQAAAAGIAKANRVRVSLPIRPFLEVPFLQHDHWRIGERAVGTGGAHFTESVRAYDWTLFSADDSTADGDSRQRSARLVVNPAGDRPEQGKNDLRGRVLCIQENRSDRTGDLRPHLKLNRLADRHVNHTSTRTIGLERLPSQGVDQAQNGDPPA
jgi:hypothetical protein